MIADLSRVASTIREDSLTARISRLRAEILAALKAQGYFTIRDGDREFTIKLKATKAADPAQPK